MKLPATDEAYIPDTDAFVSACGGGFPRVPHSRASVISYKNFQDSEIPQGMTVTKEVHLSGYGFSVVSGRALCPMTALGTYSLYIDHAG